MTNLKPIFEPGFSTKILNEMKDFENEMKPVLWEEVSSIDKRVDLSSEEKLGNIFNCRRRMKRNLYLKKILQLGGFKNYLLHCEYLIYIASQIEVIDEDSPNHFIQRMINNSSRTIEKIKSHDLTNIEELIVKIDNSFSPVEYTDEEMELSSLNMYIMMSLISMEKLEFYEGMYKEGTRKLIQYSIYKENPELFQVQISR